MNPTCPQCGIGLGRLVSIVQGAKTYRFDCCAVRSGIMFEPATKPLKQYRPGGRHGRYERPIEPPPRRKITMPFVPDDLEHALDMLGVRGAAVNAATIAEVD